MAVARNSVLDVLRHGVPLLSLYVLDGNVSRYLLLTAFNLSLGLMLIVAMTRDPSDPTAVDARSRMAVSRLAAVSILSTVFALAAAFIMIPIFMPAFILSAANDVDWWEVLSYKPFWVMLIFIALIAGLKAQLAFEAVTVVGAKGPASQSAPVVGDMEQDRNRSKAAYAAQVTLIATFVLLSYVMIYFGAWGYRVLPIAFAALLIFYDTRPDLGRKIFPELWQQARPRAQKAKPVPRVRKATPVPRGRGRR